MGEIAFVKVGEKVREKTGEKVGQSLGEIDKLNLCLKRVWVLHGICCLTGRVSFQQDYIV